jgi:hypothetical protein
MPLVLAGASSGSTTIQATDGATQTITLPNNTGTVLTTASTFGGTGPAFSAYASAGQSLTAATATKVIFNTKTFDTNSNFDATTNYRFTPTVAGYYQVNFLISWNTSGTATFLITQLYKNGTVYLSTAVNQNNTTQLSSAGSDVVYLNGSTDYVEIYVTAGAASQSTFATSIKDTRFSAAMVRSA